jgi:hypothetical protein
MYMCIRICIYIDTYYVYIHMYICIYIYVCIFMYMYIHMYVNILSFKFATYSFEVKH